MFAEPRFASSFALCYKRSSLGNILLLLLWAGFTSLQVQGQSFQEEDFSSKSVSNQSNAWDISNSIILLYVKCSFAVSALSGKGGGQEDVSPANMRNAINQLMQLGFSRDDCANALKQCKGLLVRWFGLGLSLALNDYFLQFIFTFTTQFDAYWYSIGTLTWKFRTGSVSEVFSSWVHLAALLQTL